MAFEKVSTILKEADKKNTAVLAYDCFNYESIEWLVEAGEELQIPVIVMLYPAMLDSIPIVCITGNVSSKVLGTDAFQEVDITGITLPVTKHNFLVNRPEDIAPAIREGDIIHFDIPNRKLDVEITDAEMAARLKGFKPPALRWPRGVFRKYVDRVSSASEGATT